MNKRIGFADCKLDNFHANTFLKLLRGPLADSGFEVGGCRGLFPEEDRLWAEKNSVPFCRDWKDLAAHCDYFMILAPSNPEVHLKLAQEILPFGRPTYIDKTFAPDLKTAEEIFLLSDRFRAPVQSSSALRYAAELDNFRSAAGRESVQSITTWGGGRSFAEYAIHPLEMAVTVMGSRVRKMMRIGSEEYSTLVLVYEGNRTAFVNVYADMPYQAAVTTKDKKTVFLPMESPFFQHLLEDVLRFFESGRPSVDRKETLLIREVLDLAETSNREKLIEIRKGAT